MRATTFSKFLTFSNRHSYGDFSKKKERKNDKKGKIESSQLLTSQRKRTL